MRIATILAAAAACVFALAVACHNDNSSPTQPIMVTPTTPTPTPRPGTAPTPTPSGGTTHMVAVGQGGNNFVDSQSGTSTTTIKAGDTVQWNFVSSIQHTTTSGSCCTASGLWDSGVHASGFAFSHTFLQAGTFPYFCVIHGSAMTGTVVVNP
jgi:plastocyanin